MFEMACTAENIVQKMYRFLAATLAGSLRISKEMHRANAGENGSMAAPDRIWKTCLLKALPCGIDR